MPASLKHLTDKKLNLSSLLAKWKDGLFYTAAVIKVDKNTKRCLVCFEDGSEIWLQNRDLHIQLSLDQLNEDDDIVCSVCDDGASEPPNEIIICDICQQGYHQKCHTPPVDSSKIDETDTDDHKDWFCTTCSYILNQSNRNFSVANNNNNIEQKQEHHTNKGQSHTSNSPPSANKRGGPAARTADKIPNESLLGSKSKAIIPTATSKSVHVAASQTTTPNASASTTIKNGIPTTKNQVDSNQSSSKTVPQVQSASSSVGTIDNQNKQSIVASASPICKPANEVVLVKQYSSSSSKHKQPHFSSSLGQARVSTSSSTPSSSLSSPSFTSSNTVSSALTVGSAAGRTKQDVVDQSNRQKKASAEGPTLSSSPVTVKHAVRKSSVNFVIPPTKQSALPIATRSIPGSAPAKVITTPTRQPQTIVPSTASPQPSNNNSNNDDSASSSPRRPVSPSLVSSALLTSEPRTVAPVISNNRISGESHKSIVSPGVKALTVVRPAPLSMGLAGSVIEKSTSAPSKVAASSGTNPGDHYQSPEIKKMKKTED